MNPEKSVQSVSSADTEALVESIPENIRQKIRENRELYREFHELVKTDKAAADELYALKLRRPEMEVDTFLLEHFGFIPVSPEPGTLVHFTLEGADFQLTVDDTSSGGITVNYNL